MQLIDRIKYAACITIMTLIALVLVEITFHVGLAPHIVSMWCWVPIYVVAWLVAPLVEKRNARISSRRCNSEMLFGWTATRIALRPGRNQRNRCPSAAVS